MDPRTRYALRLLFAMIAGYSAVIVLGVAAVR